jgi:hypothetical protein
VNAFTDRPADTFKRHLHTAAATLTAVANDGVNAEKHLRVFTQHHAKARGHTLVSATSSAPHPETAHSRPSRRARRRPSRLSKPAPVRLTRPP